MAVRAAGGLDSDKAVRTEPGPTGAIGRAAVARSSGPNVWTRRATLAGRIGIWAIPVLAVLAALSLASSDAFSTDRARFTHFLATRWSSPMSIALTTATVVFSLIAVLGLAALLYAGRARKLALAGAVPGVAGAIMMVFGVGSTVVQKQGAATAIWDGRFDDFKVTPDATGTGAAVLVFGGAILLTLGWVLLGFAVMRTHGLNRGDGGLLAIGAPLVFLGGFVLHILPALGAFMFGAAGLGIIVMSGRVAAEAEPSRAAARAVRVPVTGPSAFARFTDDEDVAAPAVAASAVTTVAPPIVDGVRSHQSTAAHGVHTGAAHAHGVVPAPATERSAPARRRGLGSLSRGISTAWQVNRSNRASAAGAKATKPTGEPRDPMKGLVNDDSSTRRSGSRSRWSSMLNGSRPFTKSDATEAANGNGNGSGNGNGNGKSGSNGNGSNGKASGPKGSTPKDAMSKDVKDTAPKGAQPKAPKGTAPKGAAPKAGNQKSRPDGVKGKANNQKRGSGSNSAQEVGGSAAGEDGRGTARE